MPFAAAMSEHPLTAHAVGEVTGAVLEQIGDRPDFATVFVTPPHAGALEDVMGTVDEVLHPLVSLGCAAESVLGPHREVEQGAAVTLFAGHVGPLVALALDAVPSETGDGLTLRGWPAEIPFSPEALVLVGDPYSFPAESFLDWIDANHCGLRVVGGMASAGRGPGGNRLALGTRVTTSGAVGAFLGPGAEVATLVSQGCRPFGNPLVVTRAERNLLFELAGRPALERLVAQARDSLSEEEVVLLESGGLHLGRVIDEHKEHFGRGDFLVRNVLGADRSTGAIAVGDPMAVGTTVQFHLPRRLHGRRGPARVGQGAPGRRRSRVHLQRPRDTVVRRAAPRRPRVDRTPGCGPDGGVLRRRGARARRGAELRPRLHGVGGFAPGPLGEPRCRDRGSVSGASRARRALGCVLGCAPV